MKRFLTECLLTLFILLSASCSRNAIDENTIVLFTWSDYLSREVLEDFTKETGIRVYLENFKTNEDMYAKLELSPSYYDLIIPSDFMISRLIEEGKLAELDPTLIPNARYVRDHLRKPVYDQQGKYSLPYAWGTVGIVYDKRKVSREEASSIAVLWNPTYTGSIIMSDSIRETIGIALISLGYSVNTNNPQEIREAGALLKTQQPLIMGYMGDTVKTLMGTGEATLALTWSGTAVIALRENQHMDFTHPKEGTTFFIDSFIVPKDSRKKEMAQKLINYLYRPEVGYKTWEYVGFPTPNSGTFALLPEEEQKDRRWYPDPATTARFQQILDVEEATLQILNQTWLELKV